MRNISFIDYVKIFVNKSRIFYFIYLFNCSFSFKVFVADVFICFVLYIEFCNLTINLLIFVKRRLRNLMKTIYIDFFPCFCFFCSDFYSFLFNLLLHLKVFNRICLIRLLFFLFRFCFSSMKRFNYCFCKYSTSLHNNKLNFILRTCIYF